MPQNKFSINSFQEGMNKDLSPLYLKNTTYRDAKNIRLIPNEGGTGGSVEYMKGNILSFSIPDTKGVWKITPSLFTSFSLTIDGITCGVSSNCSSLKEIYDELYIIFGEAVSYYGNDIVFYGNIVSSTYGITNIVYGESSPSIIGWVTIKDVLYLHTKTNSGNGQWWRLNSDNSLTLKYNNYLNSSNPLPKEDGVIGIYERENVQKIFWTDNTNSLRYLNVAGEQCLATPKEFLNIFNNENMGVPILQSINQNGYLTAGVKQIGRAHV